MTRSAGLRFSFMLPMVVLATACTVETPEPFANFGSTPITVPPPAPAAPAPTPTGQVVIAAQDPTGRPLSGASVSFRCPESTACNFGYRDGGSPGVVALDTVPVGQREFYAYHPLGWTDLSLSVAAGQRTETTIRIPPKSEATASLLSVLIPATSVAANRSELVLHVTVAISTAWLDEGYAPPYTWLTGAEILDCSGSPGGGSFRCQEFAASDVAFQSTQPPYSTELSTPMKPSRALPAPGTPGPRLPLSAIFLLDQGSRIPRLDPFNLRHLAARNFVSRLRPEDQVVFGGFAGAYGDPALPAVLPQTPVWISPVDFPDAAIDDLVSRVGGGSPLLDALDAATERLGTMGPAGQRKALVVLTAGTDDSLATASDRRLRWQALRLRQTALGIETILVVRKRPPATDIAEMLEADLGEVIVLRVPEDMTEWNNLDDLYSAAGLAADLLTGKARIYDLVFRIKADANGPAFPVGSLLRGQVVLQDECNPWWSWCELHLPFVARVP